MQAREKQAAAGIFGDGDNLISGIFDTTACLVSGIIGGGNPNCKGKGKATVELPSSSSSSSNNGDTRSTQYNFNYDTNKDGTLKVTIMLQRGGSCTYDIKADGKDVQAVVDEAAARCLKEK